LLILFSNIALIVSTSAVSGASTPNAQSVSSVSVQTISSSNFNAPYGIAINSSGDIFVTNTGNSTIAVIAKSSGIIFGQHIDTKQVNTPVILNAATGLSGLSRLSVGPGGDLYIANGGNNTITVIPKATGTLFGQHVIANEANTLTAANSNQNDPLSNPYGLSVGPGGDLFYISGGVITVLPKNSGILFGQPVEANVPTAVNAALSISGPLNTAFGPGGDLYCMSGGSVIVLADSSGTIFGQPVAVNKPSYITEAGIGIAFDDTGNLYVGNGNSITIDPKYSGTIFGQEVTANTTTSLNTAIGLNDATGLAFDGAGDLYIVDNGNNDVEAISAHHITKGEQGGAPNQFENTTTCSTSNPVNCATGDFWHTFTDVDIPGLGVPLSISRTYNSNQATTDSLFGYGWSSNLFMSLSIGSSGQVTVNEDDGSQVTFSSEGNGSFSAPSYVFAQLSQSLNGDYLLTDTRTRITYTFSSTGQLLSEAPQNGEETTFTYNSSNQLVKVTDPSGRSLVLSYNSSGEISSVTDPMGRATSYNYDTSGNLTSVTDPMGRVTSYTYNSSHLMTSMTDPNSGTLSNIYNSSGQVISQTDPIGLTTKFSYSGNPVGSSGSTTVITDPNGNVLTHHYADLELLSVTSGSGANAATWQYTYDPFSLGIISSTDPNGNTTQNTYGSSGNLITTTNALGETTSYSYNSFNEVTCKALPEASSPCSGLVPPASIVAPSSGMSVTIAPPSSSPPPYVTYNEYDTSGNLIWTTTASYNPGSSTPTSQSTSYNLYNGESVTLNGITDSCDTKAPSSSLPCATIDSNGVVKQLSYDKYGDLIKSSTPNTGNNPSSITTSSYDEDGELISTVSPDGNVSGANAANYTTTYLYDAAGELISSTTGSSGASVIPRITKYSYDNNGNQISSTESLSPSFVGADSISSTTTSSGTATNSGINIPIPSGSSSGDEEVLSVTSSLGRPAGLESVSSGDIVDYAGNGTYGSSGIGGPATSASFNAPYDVASDNAGDIAIADRNNSVIDFVPSSSGTYFGQVMAADHVYRIAGNGTYGSSGIGGPAIDAELNGPGAVALSCEGVFIANTDNSTIDFVPEVSGIYFGQAMTEGDIYQVAGNGLFGHSGIGGPATSAELDGPSAIAVSSSGNLFIADTNNNVVDFVPEVSGTYFGQAMTEGDIYTVAGSGAYGSSGIGGEATSASLNAPTGLAVDQKGNLFLSDHNNNVVDMVPNTSGTYFSQAMTEGDIYRVAGDGEAGYSGDGGPATNAELNGPGGLAIAPNGDLIIADSYNSKIRVVASSSGTYFSQAMTTGDIYSIAGEAGVGSGGNNGPASSSQLDGPSSVATDLGGDIFISDLNNDIIRAIASSTPGFIPPTPTGFSLIGSSTSGNQETSVYAAPFSSTTSSAFINLDHICGIREAATLSVFSDINTANPVNAWQPASSSGESISFSPLSLSKKNDLLVTALGEGLSSQTKSSLNLPQGFADLSSAAASAATGSPVSYENSLVDNPTPINSTTTPIETLSSTTSSPLTGIELALSPGNETSTTKTLYNADNEPVMTTNAAGQSTLTCYDGNGNVVETVLPTGVAENSLTPASCNLEDLYPNGILSSSGTENLPTLLASDATLTAYNALGEKTEVSSPPPASQSTRSITTYTYDPAGNLIEELTPPTSTGAQPSESSFSYDAANQMTSETIGVGTASSSTTSFCYDPNGDKTAVVPGDGNTGVLSTCSTSSPWNALTTSSSGTQIPDPYQTDYVYNSTGEKISQIRPATSSSPNGTITTYTYDPAGNETSIQEPDGVVVKDTYTPQDQILSSTYSDGTAPITYTYDPSGQLLTMTDGTGTTTYSYDPFGDLTSVTNGAGQSVSYTYNSLGEETSISYPLPASISEASSLVAYGYDAAGNMTDVSDFSGHATNISYNQDSLPVLTNLSSSSGKAASISTTYDAADNITGISLDNGSQLSFSYNRAPNGGIAGETDIPSSSSVSYNYDAVGRLTQETTASNSATAYNFDPSGNLLMLPNGASATYNDAGELISSATPSVGTTYTYNANGDRVSASSSGVITSSASWNGANELSSYQNTSSTMSSAEYNGLGQRVTATFTTSSSSTKENYLYDDTGSVPNLIMDSTNAYVYDGDTAPFEQINLQTGNITYLITDALGSVRGVLSSSGTLEATTNYSAYGTPTTTGGLSNFTPFGFAGSYVDPTGLSYLINRYYDPSTAQFLSVDPLVDETNQPYTYTGGDPVNEIDPSGDSGSSLINCITSVSIPTEFLSDGIVAVGDGVGINPPAEGYGTFQGGKAILVTLRKGTRIYRLSSDENPSRIGNFFSPVKPANMADVERMLNINQYGNTGKYVTVYELEHDTTFYVGKVAGGTGYQFVLPVGTTPAEVLAQVGPSQDTNSVPYRVTQPWWDTVAQALVETALTNALTNALADGLPGGFGDG
jgi:RHS repeat-associated protein